MGLSQAELDRRAAFLKKFRGVGAHKVAMAMSCLQHGVDYAKCSKAMLADAWADTSHTGHKHTWQLSLEAIAKKIEQLYPNGQSAMHLKPKPLPVKTSQEKFEEWLATVRTLNDFTRVPEGDNIGYIYRDLDVDWLWQAWKAGRESRL